MRRLTRRQVLKFGALGTGALFLPGRLESWTASSAHGHPLAGGDIGVESPLRPPFEAELPIPPVIDMRAGGELEMEIRAGTQEIIPGISTPIWAYNRPGDTPRTPGPTILARKGRPVTARFVNQLPPDGDLGNIILPEDIPHRSHSEVSVHNHGINAAAGSDGNPELVFGPGEEFVYEWPHNDYQRPATLFYHDHAIHVTGQQVYRGLKGFYVITDDLEESLPLPTGEFDVALDIADVIIDPDSGRLVYDNQPGQFEGVEGDVITVNGVQQPRLGVARGRYRFRLLNASDAREYRLALSDNSIFHVIGSDHGLLPAPEATRVLRITPAERYEVVIDFANYRPGTRIILENRLDDLTDRNLENRDPEERIGQVMAFDVTGQVGDTRPLPGALRRLDDPTPVPTQVAARRNWEFDRSGGQWRINSLPFDPNRVDARPQLGSAEVWRFENPAGGWTHPIHPHLVRFLIVGTDERPLQAGESGWKDTVWLGPNVKADVLIPFAEFAGVYVMHCHNISHEDFDMMTQFEVVGTGAGGSEGGSGGGSGGGGNGSSGPSDGGSKADPAARFERADAPSRRVPRRNSRDGLRTLKRRRRRRTR